MVTNTLIAIILPFTLLSHGGRTNSEGCHNDRINGGYHCHTQQRPTLQPGPWTVTRVVDGDTIKASDGAQDISIRLGCIDSPELSHDPYGDEARVFLQSLLPNGTSFESRIISQDRYGRVVAEVLVNDENLNLVMVQAGQAVVYRDYLRDCDADAYNEAEEFALQRDFGLWRDDAPIMPWDWRRGVR